MVLVTGKQAIVLGFPGSMGSLSHHPKQRKLDSMLHSLRIEAKSLWLGLTPNQGLTLDR